MYKLLFLLFLSVCHSSSSFAVVRNLPESELTPYVLFWIDMFNYKYSSA